MQNDYGNTACVACHFGQIVFCKYIAHFLLKAYFVPMHLASELDAVAEDSKAQMRTRDSLKLVFTMCTNFALHAARCCQY